jgi:hypothetical protein
MRLCTLICCSLALAAIALPQHSLCQDTNFAAGPQYLITTDSTLFLRPIATPSMSLAPMPPPAPLESAVATEVPVSPTPGAPATPSLGLARVLWGNDWVDYATGAAPPVEIEVSSREPLRELPPSLFDPGTTALTNFQSLRELGYDVGVGEDAAYWKAHKPHATHVYTNSDIERLHGS